MSQVFTARRHLVEFVQCNGDRLPMRQISISCSLKLAHDLSCSLASAQVAPSHLSHTHTQYVLKQDLHSPYYPLVLLHKELESQSWSRLRRWVASEKIFRVPLPKTQRLFAKHLEPLFTSLCLHLFTFQCLGLKLGPSFETRGSAAMARIPAYTDDFFEGAAVQLKGLKHVETKACWLDKKNLYEGDVWFFVGV